MLLSRLLAGGVQSGAVLPNGVDRALEAEPMQVTLIEGGGVLHEGADEIIGDKEQLDFLTHHFGSKAAYRFHLHSRFNVAKKQFH